MSLSVNVSHAQAFTLLQQPLTLDITQRTISTRVAPLAVVRMTAMNTKKTPVEQKLAQDGKPETTKKNWLARHLRRPGSRQGKDGEDSIDMRRQMSLKRPKTAPSPGTARRPAAFPAALEPPLTRPFNKPPPRPPRPDPGVIRDVNAWLDASMIKPAPALMAGLPYWREGTFTGPAPSAHVQYAVPIVQRPNVERPSTSHSQHIKSFCRRAKRMQVRMPSLLRIRSQHVTVKQINRRSTSMPLFSTPKETQAGPTSTFLARSRSLMHATPRSTVATCSIQGGGWLRLDQGHLISQPQRLGSPAGVRFNEQESHIERHINAAFGQSARAEDASHPSTAANHINREDSMGNLSDAPTYFSGLPPPSYRSRAASIVTTSSFGCVDGMSTERRQISQQRAAQRSRGMKGKFKKLAQKAHLTK